MFQFRNKNIYTYTLFNFFGLLTVKTTSNLYVRFISYFIQGKYRISTKYYGKKKMFTEKIKNEISKQFKLVVYESLRQSISYI